MRLAWLLPAAMALTFAAPAAASFPQQVDATVQPNGTVSETSSTLPKTAKTATIAVKPAADDSSDFFGSIQTILAATPSKRERVLTCIGMYEGLAVLYDEGVELDEVAPEIAPLFLLACLELAIQNNQTNGRAAVSSCPAVRVGVPMDVSHTSKGYRIILDGKAKKPRRRPLRVRCRKDAGTMRIKLRPRKRSRSLRSVIGPKLAIGFYNTSSGKPVSMRTTFNVK